MNYVKTHVFMYTHVCSGLKEICRLCNFRPYSWMQVFVAEGAVAQISSCRGIGGGQIIRISVALKHANILYRFKSGGPYHF